MSLKDTATGYGWVSIALHWITFVSICLLLYFGSSISAYTGGAREDMLALHTSTAVLSYVFLWARVIWRFVYGHPGPTEEQGRIAFFVGKWVHMAMLVVLSLMLLTGPLTAWFSGIEIRVLDWFVIPSPFDANMSLGTSMHRIHRWMAIALFVGILLHIGGVYKHLAFNQDGTFTKMLIPAKAEVASEEGSDPSETEEGSDPLAERRGV